MKSLTIPRLELLSCLLLAELIKSVSRAIEREVKVNRIICWTDSTIAYHWVTQPRKEWKQWIESRVNKIRDILPPEHWRHVPGDLNPADLATREIKPKLSKTMNAGFTVQKS